ncbi:hypothetical protein Bca52824_039769 [Brassica carinata]|uniref:Uncharacterized protein n=1 Tax=Brassica carinata TaxID=52824 RepID=A0A8X7UUW6_BRACI|nr:hypothetical protein Bca52824_039769 [Brassica carinata]
MHVFDQTSSCYDRWGKAIDRGFYTDGDRAFPRWLGYNQKAAWIHETRRRNLKAVDCKAEQYRLRGSTKQEEGTSKMDCKASNLSVMARMMVR